MDHPLGRGEYHAPAERCHPLLEVGGQNIRGDLVIPILHRHVPLSDQTVRLLVIADGIGFKDAEGDLLAGGCRRGSHRLHGSLRGFQGRR